MGIGDSIGKAAENAMEDLAGTSEPTGKSRVPDPTDPNDDAEVHSSISEGSNAMEAEKEKAPGLKTGAAPGPVSENPFGGDNGEAADGGGPACAGRRRARPAGEEAAGQEQAAADAQDVPRDVPGPAGLPDGDPDELRADPSEGDQDPSSSMGRG